MLLHPHTKRPLKWVFFDLDNTLWDFDGNATTDGTSITGSYTYSAQGIYQAILTASLSTAQCSATDTITIYVGDVSLDELGLDNTLSLYPNPYYLSKCLHREFFTAVVVHVA